jgi:hypothetical protein
MAVRGVIVAVAVAALLVIAANPPAGAKPAQTASHKSKAIRRAAARLANKRFTHFAQSGMSSFDQRLPLCRNKHFIYDTVSSTEGGGDPDVRRVEGRWQVVSAHLGKRVWKARVRGTPEDGSGPITVRFRTNGKRTTIDGRPVIVERSDLCG